MAATLTRERFTSEEWVFERKLDGIRLLAYREGACVRLFSRNRLPQNDAYPSIVSTVLALSARELILDGEATGMFGPREPPGYHVFDLLWLDGQDLTALPLERRRERLSQLALVPPLHLVPRIAHPEPWKLACAEGWEGVIAKRLGSVYESRRSPNWLKMKCEASQELVVGGFTDPRGARVGLGALLVGHFTHAGFAFAGKVGTGFDTKLLRELRARLDALEVAASPFALGSGLPRAGVHWVRPEVVVQVAFMEWTGHGKLRHPRLVGVRLDNS
jgi:bifunctional non-homologous end joining protein LigD